MNLQRLLQLCEILQECEKLPPGMFRLWARANAIREIAEIITIDLPLKHAAKFPVAAHVGNRKK